MSMPLRSIVLSFTIACVRSSTTCLWDSGKGAKFDLTPLKTQNPVSVSDRAQTTGQNDFVYTFGICDNVAAPPVCLTQQGEQRVGIGVFGKATPGWQTKKGEDWATTPAGQEPHCMYLGNPEVAPEWSLLSDKNPGMGVQITYTQGQHCTQKNPDGSKKRRALNVRFVCSKHDIFKKDEQVIYESAHCEYDITIESSYACPVECGFGSGGNMCNNHGICRYDTDAGRSRCFCNAGYAGGGCDQEATDDTPTYGPVLGLLIFVTITTVALIAGIVGLWRYMRNRTLNSEVTLSEAYGQLRNDFNSN